MPRDITITFEDGSKHVYKGAPDDVTPDQVTTRAAKDFGKAVTALDGGRAPTLGDKVVQQIGNIAAGAVRGAGSIGATILAPIDAAARAVGISNDFIGRTDRRQAMDQALGDMGAQTDSLAYKGGKLGAEIAGTLGVGGAVANALARAPAIAAAAPNALQAIRTAGMSAGSATGPANMLLRMGGGAVTGGASAGLVNPDDATTGAVLGGAMPAALKAAGAAGQVVGNAAGMVGRSIIPQASPEVAALAKRAQELGINIPADRIVNSKPLNAAAASLNYVPFSGRAATEEAMSDGLNRALSRTFGQNSDNVTQALRTASDDLGRQFDTVLQSNSVKITPEFKTALAQAEDMATNELGAESSGIIRKQIAEILTKGASGEIDGQAAYNIKKTLDRIGSRNAPEAYYARELKKSLMDALNASLGTDGAASFAKLRQQYGNMLALENLAQNGAEGGVSAARLANMKNINNKDLQELADIAAQFMRTRESPHGAAQRVTLAGLGGAAAGVFGGIPGVVGGAAAGRLTNSLLNSQAAKNAALGVSGQPNALQRLLENPDVVQFGYRAAPVLAGGR